jgi:site-specific recombinase XerD
MSPFAAMTTSKRQAKRQANDKQSGWTPPRGIRFYDDETRPQPFFCQWRDPETGARTTKSFASAHDRETWARDLAAERQRSGDAVLSLDPGDWKVYEQFRRMIGDTDPLLVAAEWLASRRGADSLASSMTITDAVGRYIESRTTEHLSRDTYRHLRKHLRERLCGFCGDRRLHELKPDDIRAWLSSLRNPRTGEKMEVLTQRHHRKDLNTFLDHAVREGWLARNPCESVRPPKVEEDDVLILSPEDAAKLFAANRDQPIIGRLALEAFAGFRYTSAARITADRIRFDDQGIELPGRDHKSKRRKYVEGHPPNLWAWLRYAPDSCWSISQRNYLKLKGDAFTRAGVVNPGNVLRKSFCSYHLAMGRDATRTAFLLQHSSPKMLYSEYNGVATQAQGIAYFAILP